MDKSPDSSDPSQNCKSLLRSENLSTVFLHGTFKGEPAIRIPQDVEASLAARFENTLIGKFSQGRPSMDIIRKFVAVQNFRGKTLIGLIDKKHILIRFDNPEDYVRLFSRLIWNVNGKPMRILKWTADFCIDRESSIVPIWISLPMLPIHLTNQDFIFSLVSSFSKPLRIDTATEQLKRPSVARVQVEFDLLDLLPPRVWVQSETGTSFWQKIDIEEPLPMYCNYCLHLGHHENFCTIKHPELHHTYTAKQGPKTHKEYRPKQSPQHLTPNQAAEILGRKNEPNFEVKDIVQGNEPNFEVKDQQDIIKLKETMVQLNVENDQQLVDKLILASAAATNLVASSPIMQHKQGVEQGRANQRQEMDIAKSPTKEIDDSGLQGTSSKGQAAALCTQKGKENVYEDGMVTKLNLATNSNAKIIGTSEALTTRNSFDMLSELDTQLSVDSIQAELQFMNLDSPHVGRTGYTSEKDSKVKLTPAQRIRRTRKKKKIFDL